MRNGSLHFLPCGLRTARFFYTLQSRMERGERMVGDWEEMRKSKMCRIRHIEGLKRVECAAYEKTAGR